MQKLKPLTEQVVVITGASSGIGLATARMAAERGAKVVLGARDELALSRICDELTAAGAEACFVACDVASEPDVARLLSTAVDRHGRIDTWMNVAGVGIIASLDGTVMDDHRRLFETNYWGVVHGSLAAARQLRGQRSPGAIINVGSSFSDLVIPTMGAYAASKFAVKAFTNALRVELAQEGLPVSVTLVKPGVVDSMFYDHAETTLDTAPRIPSPRYAPSVVAAALLDAAEHHHREISVGAPAVMSRVFGRLMPGVVEWVTRAIREPVWRDPSATKRPSAVRTIPHEGRERSGRASARDFSVTATVERHPWLTFGLLTVTSAALGAHAVARAKKRAWL